MLIFSPSMASATHPPARITCAFGSHGLAPPRRTSAYVTVCHSHNIMYLYEYRYWLRLDHYA